MAHEAGHGTLSPYSWINHFIGFTLHTVRTHFLSNDLFAST
jgi:fatty acid desaturase